MISSKQESKQFIKDKKLNTVTTSKVFSIFNSVEIFEFLEKTNFKNYGIRESKSSGLFSYAVPKDKVYPYCLENYFDKKFTLCESMYYPDKEDMILQGDFCLTKDFLFSYGYSITKGKSLRESCQNFKFKGWNIDLKERYFLPSKVEKVVDYLVKNELLDIIIELTMYDIEVGINKENILIWECRNY